MEVEGEEEDVDGVEVDDEDDVDGVMVDGEDDVVGMKVDDVVKVDVVVFVSVFGCFLLFLFLSMVCVMGVESVKVNVGGMKG